MAMNFPNSPTIGAIYQAPGGPVYKWDGAMWLPQVGSGVFLEKANNLSDLTDKAAARNNLEVGWRTIKRFAPAVAETYCEVVIPADVKMVRGNFAVSPTANDLNLYFQVSFDSGATYAVGASDYINTHDWVNNATTLVRSYGTLGGAGIMTGPNQSGVFGTGSFDLSLGGVGRIFLMDARASHVPSSGATQQFHASARGNVVGKINGLRFYFSGSQFRDGSFMLIEGCA